MRISSVCVLLLATASAAVAVPWSYTAPNLLSPYASGSWAPPNGTITAGQGSLTSTAANGGSIIYYGPSLGAEYEVRSVITLGGSGGNFDTYLHATSNALYGPAMQGTAYVLELQNPTFSGASCSATLALLRVNGGLATLLSSTPAPCRSGMEMRVVYSRGTIVGYIDKILYMQYADLNILSGQPGAGVRGAPVGNFISAIDMAPRYSGGPAVVDSQSVTASSFPNRVDLRWTGAAEPDGPGIAWYQSQVLFALGV